MRKTFTAALALWTTGCVSWQTHYGGLPEAPSHSSETLRVELRGGTKVTLFEAAIVGDSLVGMSAPASETNRARVAIDRRDVQRVSTKHFSLGRTVAAVATIGIAALVIAGATSSPAPTTTSNNTCASTTPAPTA